MTSGRNQVDFTDILRHDITLKIDNSTIVFDATKAGGAATTMIGMGVTWSANDTVALCADGDYVVGKLIRVHSDNFCTVQIRGFAELPAGDSATVTRGTNIVGALGAASAKGYIRSAASGTAAELIKMGGKIVQNAVTTAVVVDLG